MSERPGRHKMSRSERAANRTYSTRFKVGVAAAVASTMAAPAPPSELGPVWDSQDVEYIEGAYELDTKLYADVNAERDVMANGRIETSVGTFAIRGFDLYMQKADMRKITRNPKGVFVQIDLLDSELEDGKLVDRVAGLGRLIAPKATPDDEVREMAYSLPSLAQEQWYSHDLHSELGVPSESENSTWERIHGLTLAKDLRLVIRKYDTEWELVSTEEYPIDYDETAVCDDEASIVAERRPTKAELAAVCRAVNDMSAYLPSEIPRIFLDHITKTFEPSDAFDDDDSHVQLSVPMERNLNGYGLKTATATHELTHVVYQQLADTDISKLYDLQSAFYRVVDEMEYAYPTEDDTWKGYDVQANEPLWAALSESTYINENTRIDDSASGHPYSNPNEMFASTLSILRTFSAEFLEKYSEMDDDKQRVLRNVVAATLKTLDSVNHDAASLERLIPEISTIKHKMDIE